MNKNANKTKQKGFVESRNKAYAKREKKGIKGPIQYAGGAIGTLAGGYLGGPIGMALGSSLGDLVGKGIGWITGSGDYVVSSPRGGIPSFRNQESTVITHREYITDITAGPTLTGGATAFDITKYPINPGQTKTFPWLASIASNYEEYEILGMVFGYVPTSGESVASTNTALGTVILSTEYDPTKPDFVNKQAMENYMFSNSGKPSQPLLHPIECKKNLSPVKQLYVRNTLITGTDLRWSDFANFYIATVGCPAVGTVLGELWVTYRVRLHKPRLPITVSLGGQIASGYVEKTGVTAANVGGTAFQKVRGSIPIAVSIAGNVSFPATPNMNYLVVVCMRATSLNSVTFNTVVGATQLTYYFSDTANTQTSSANGPVNVSTMQLQCTNTDTDGVITFNFTAAAIVGTGWAEVYVTQIDETI